PIEGVGDAGRLPALGLLQREVERDRVAEPRDRVGRAAVLRRYAGRGVQPRQVRRHLRPERVVADEAAHVERDDQVDDRIVAARPESLAPYLEPAGALRSEDGIVVVLAVAAVVQRHTLHETVERDG